MKKILIKRLLMIIPMLIGITFISYSLMLLAPGDPTAMMLDPKINAADLMRIKANLGLDKPFYIQYFYWLKNLLSGNLGFSYINGRPVFYLIMQRLPATLLLMISSLVITLFITIPLGIWSAVNHNKWQDKLVTVFTFSGMSVPPFWLALVIIMFFSMNLGWFPSSGMYSPGKIDSSFFVASVDLLHHMFLPLLTMTLLSLAGLTKFMKTSMVKVLSQDYIKTAKSLGFSQNKILYKYALKNSLIPVITILGMSIPSLVGGSFIIEYIFAWPGMGRLGVDSIFMRDFPVIMGIILMSSTLIILGNLLADIGYLLVDPRIRYSKEK